MFGRMTALASIFTALALAANPTSVVSSPPISYPQPMRLPEIIHWPKMIVENDQFEQIYRGKVWSFDVGKSITLFDGVELYEFDLLARETTYTILNAVKVGTKVELLMMTDPYGHTSITIKPAGYETPYVFPG
jgi:hypothetical protein